MTNDGQENTMPVILEEPDYHEYTSALAALETDGFYKLRLFVTGSTPRSAIAITNVQAICNEHLAGRYELEIIDLYQQPELAKANGLVAAPTLLKTTPEPVRRIIGDMSNTGQVLSGLDIQQV